MKFAATYHFHPDDTCLKKGLEAWTRPDRSIAVSSHKYGGLAILVHFTKVNTSFIHMRVLHDIIIALFPLPRRCALIRFIQLLVVFLPKASTFTLYTRWNAISAL